MRNNHIMVVDDMEIEHLKNISSDKIKGIHFSSYGKEKGKISDSGIIKTVQEFTKKGIDCYIGGGIFNPNGKISEIRNKVKEIKKYGIETVEITNSEGKFINPIFLNEVINILRGEFKKILIEIGSKNKNSIFAKDYNSWNKAIENAVNVNADEIIIEGGTGNQGIYSNENQLKVLLLTTIIKKIEELGYKDKFTIESSIPSHQINITQFFGQNISIGNQVMIFYKFINSVRTGFINNNELEELEELYKKNYLYKIFNLKNDNRLNTTKQELFGLIDLLFELTKEYNIDPNKIFFDEELYNINGDIKTTSNRIKSKILELT